ncbi:glycosyl transferase family 1 [Sphingomonas sp. Leaf231]|uniref:glycosyltransferase n=1 Tax=Sphingomonas sp. Leaf231 TaxID=1736301 RepID=UPI0006F33277|nr:glycosyltransferase [Sphingomonas sp. Leaf231]KQN92539.1 glycosyl transferase family 1 [Sphingomonas sp. Leaf231]
MRIIDVNEFYSPTGGGVRSYLDRKMALLSELGHQQIVIAPGREDRVEERPGGARIHYVKSPGLPFDSNYGLFWDAAPVHALLDHYQPDVVENCSPWRSAAIVADWRGPAIRSWFMHNDNLEAYPKRWFARVASEATIERAFGWYDRYMGRWLDRFDTVVTNGPVLTERLRARGLRIDATMTLGIEREHFSPALRSKALRAAMLAQCGLPEDAYLLIGIGRHHAEKRWPMVIDAVRRAGARLPIGLVLLGLGPDTRTLERHIDESPHVRMFQPIFHRGQLASIMASADAFVHGSETETFGLVASEALASGLPLAVPDRGGSAAIARPEFAETYRSGDAYDCARAIVALASRDQTLLRRAAGLVAPKVWSDREHASALVAHYQSLIDERAGVSRSA